MSDIELRELHQMYWALSEEDPATFPGRKFEEFSAFLIRLEDRYLICFINSLRFHYRELVEKSVPAGLKVIEKYLQPNPVDMTDPK